MDPAAILDARQAAEAAVADMADGPLKIKAFEIVFSRLLHTETDPGLTRTPKIEQGTTRGRALGNPPGRVESLRGRILILKSDTYFEMQRTLGDIREELASRGWHYALTAMSGVMQGLVSDRELRRERVNMGTKKVWKYSNY